MVAPLIQTKWNQNKYYNNLCPAVSDGIDGKAFTGCVATAMAQIMKYWSYPSSGIGSHFYTWREQTLSANFGETTYDWNNMADYYEYYYVNGTDPYAQGLPEPSEVEISAVATLMYHCGVSVEMNYGGNSTGGSGAANYYVANALKTYFNYKNTAQHKQKSYNSTVYYTDDQWIAMLKAELDADRPIQYGGQDPNPNGGGHAFVCDGYNSDDYFHFNWGWAGHYNGYFSINNLDTGAYGEAGSGNGVYTRDQEAVIGIEPGSMLPAPTNLAYTINGLNEIVLTWDAVSAAASYNIYCNGNLIGNTAENTYSETAQFGTHNYFVRCVDANSQLSLLSNTVTVTIDYPTPIVTNLTATLSGNNANLSWNAPEWCYPETPSATLAIGTQQQSNTYVPWGDDVSFYWGHRHLAGTISGYDGMRLYSVDFHANNEGTYEICIYQGTSTSSWGYTIPSTQIASQTITVTNTGWNTVDFSSSIIIDGEQDLWVFVHNPEPIVGLSSYFCTADGNEGCYYTPNIIHYTQNTFTNLAFLIKAYVTDGTYTYNLYRDGTAIAQNISETSYNANLNDNAANLFTVKTNYYGGVTAASNAIGFAKGTASVANLKMAANDQMTVTEGSSLTVSDTMSNGNAENLIIENGAQLIHNTGGVKATVKKKISAYSTENEVNCGWHLISYPHTGSGTINQMDNLLNPNYDLYYYDEPTHHWMNYKNSDNGFTQLEATKGYLYANNNEVSLGLKGTLEAGNAMVNVPLSYTSNAGRLKGFNLVGNPFAHNVTSYTRNNVVEECYRLNANGSDILPSTIDEDNPLLPAEGFFVKATNANASITFNGQTRGDNASSTSSGAIQLDLTQNGLTLDRFIVKRDGEPLEKLTLNENSPIIYATHNGQDMAVVTTEGIEQTIQLKASKDDTYTLSARMKNMDLAYLHLIDNATGADVDLLQTPEYTFNASATDYASRFKLVFFANGDIDGSNDSFAFHSNGNWIIINDGEATLQVVDLMGRIISNERISGTCNKSINAPAGVYLLRLVCGKDIKTQKVVIE